MMMRLVRSLNLLYSKDVFVVLHFSLHKLQDELKILILQQTGLHLPMCAKKFWIKQKYFNPTI